MALGAILVIMGGLWTLQGLDLLGQEGGMNDRSEWAVFGLTAVLGGLGLVYWSVRSPRI